MLRSLRESLALVLLALLPFHAFLVTVGTKLLSGPNHAPITELALWKEGVLGLVLVLVFIEVLLGKFRNQKSECRMPTVDMLDGIIIALLGIALLLFAYGLPPTTYALLLGIKYDFVPLVAFLLLRRVEWSTVFRGRVRNLLILVGGIVATLGILSLWLPQELFVWLGYSDLHSLYRPDAPLAAFQQIGGTDIRRMQSVMSGPNQLGLWLLIPLSVLFVTSKEKGVSYQLSVIGALLLAAMLFSFSRSAVLAAGVIIAVLLWQMLSRKMFVSAFLATLAASMVGGVVLYQYSPDLLVRAASSRDHISRPLEAISRIAEQPFGYGLGTAGPASNRVSDTCVHLEEGSDASWAADRPELCVFVGDIQVQPEETCNCPFLPENWYLQLGIEMGVLGMVLFVVLILLVLRKISGVGYRGSDIGGVFSMVLGISIAALFLHAWEDAAIAYTIWILVAVSLSETRNPVAK